MVLNNEVEDEKELEIDKKPVEKHLPSLETATARIALSLQRYRVIVESNPLLAENEPERVRL